MTGCGGLGYDTVRVAKTMISESYKQLTTALWNEMQISFIIQQGKQNIYDEFFRQLKLHGKCSFTVSLNLHILYRATNESSIDGRFNNTIDMGNDKWCI